jgi:hypothetical protein
MADELASLVSRVMAGECNEGDEAHSLLLEKYSQPETFGNLLVLISTGRSQAVRCFAVLGLRKMTIDLWSSISLALSTAVKQNVLLLLQKERDPKVQELLISVVELIFAASPASWPEVFAFLLQFTVASDLSLAASLARILSSSDVISLVPDFPRFLSELIELGLGVDDHRIRLLTAELIVALNFPISSEMYCTMIELFSSVLTHSDADICFKTANVLKRMIELAPEIELIESFVELLQSATIENDLKLAIFIPLDELVRQRSSELIDSFELLLSLAIHVSAALFDNSCSEENRANSVTFSFIRTFAKMLNPAAFLLRSMNSESPALLFASLSALSVVVKYVSDDFGELLSFLCQSFKIDCHSVQERSIALVDQLIVNFDAEAALLTDIVINYVVAFASAEHFAVRQLALRCVIRFLFRVKVA